MSSAEIIALAERVENRMVFTPNCLLTRMIKFQGAKRTWKLRRIALLFRRPSAQSRRIEATHDRHPPRLPDDRPRSLLHGLAAQAVRIVAEGAGASRDGVRLVW